MKHVKEVTTANLKEISLESYPNFDLIDGSHPFKDQVPDGRVEYQVRSKQKGKVIFFNFDLAKKMGLVPNGHKDEMNDQLEAKILKTFGLAIINEYDILHKTKIPLKDIRPKTYMATRYLQLQHPSKLGKTSGDGRTIWNGTIRFRGITWDISSCGTGATKLSPACNINKKFYQTGDPSVSYGCGLSDVGEGLETLFFSEVLHKNGIKTERVLAIIEYEKGHSINVRASENLLRPSHFFCHLKQGHYSVLKQVADYYIDRQTRNGAWEKKDFKNSKEKYFHLAYQVAKSFSEVAAKFEDEYIFCWLDWDGDNILMDGGIIDYGSIRQFGLYHSEYRFNDDNKRFSTTIAEQKQKAKHIVRTFIQIADFLTTGKKKSLTHFKKHQILNYFESHFEECKDRNILQKIGFKKNYTEFLISNHRHQVRLFRENFSIFERSKSRRGLHKVADGITRDAIFCMRDILREYPQIYLTRQSFLNPSEFFEIIKSSYAQKMDLRISSARKRQVLNFQIFYLDLIVLIGKEFGLNQMDLLLDLTMRSSVINKYDRITGDSISHIVMKVGKLRPKLKTDELYQLIDHFVTYQNLDPDASVGNHFNFPRNKSIMRNLSLIVKDCREGL